MQRKCDQLVKSLMKRSQGVHFTRPVEWKKFGLTDYPKLIKEPMDLGTVAERVGKSYYTRLEYFANDVRLVWVRPPPRTRPLTHRPPLATEALAHADRGPRSTHTRLMHPPPPA